MKELGIDIETYSSNSIQDCGVYKYVEAEDFAILLFAYAVDGGEVQCVDLASGETLPADVLAALTDDNIVKTAYNATFERICLSRFLGMPTGQYLNPTAWQCTMVAGARMGLPLSLAQCGEVLHLEQGKMAEGKALIRYFSVPNRVKTANGYEYKRHMPTDDPEKWATFKAYNIRDVEVEQAILKKVRRMEVTDKERQLYIADQLINDRGVEVSMQMVNHAVEMGEYFKAQLLEEAKNLTGLENPNSPMQLKAWIAKETGFAVDSLNKKDLDNYTEQFKYWPKVQRLLAIRQELGKTSNKKYNAIQQCVCADGRVRGLLQFYGAARTGRWAGRLVQMQNLPQNHLPDLDHARNLVLHNDIDVMELEYSKPTQVLSELIRTAFVAKEGCVFHVCDFSAIEVRVIAWLAGETWVLDAFRAGKDIYCETASKMFGVPVEKHGRNADLRQRGKVSVLALGYEGSIGALEAMGGKKLGLSESEMKDIVYRWRESNPAIVKLWAAVEKAAITVITTGREIIIHRGTTFSYRWGALLITLPSGRTLCYPRAQLKPEDALGRKMGVVYEGVNQTTKKWGEIRTYGGRLVENIVQAIARDVLGEVILRAYHEHLDIVFHIHDETITEARKGQELAQVEALFSTPISWCSDLPLKGAGYTTPYYLKD